MTIMPTSLRSPEFIFPGRVLQVLQMAALGLLPVIVATAAVLQPVSLRDVIVGGELGRRMSLAIDGNLLQLNWEKDFIAPFRGGTYTGLNDGSGPFVGLGKTLDAMIRLAANRGDEVLVARTSQLVATVLSLQDAEGYIGLMPPDKRTWTLWDLHEEGFIILALVHDYQCFGRAESLASARKLADYVIGRWSTKPTDWEKTLPEINDYFAEIGLNYAFLQLHEATADRRYLDFAARELGTQAWDLPIILGRRPPHDGHSYMYMSHCLAQLELDELRQDPRLEAATDRATVFMTRRDGMTITGAVGQFECWTDDQNGRGKLGETCSTAYQILLFDKLLRRDGRARWGDLIERNLYNAAFGAQSPDGRRIRYYTPFEGPRAYFGPDTYCCPGNFRSLMATLPQLVYYRSADGVGVNLYTASRVRWADINGTQVTLRQETDYPATGRVTLHVDPMQEADFTLALRIPRWCEKTGVTINGEPGEKIPVPGEFLKVSRRWHRGDIVVLELAMPWRFVAGRKSQAGRVAVMRGPLVYTLTPANAGGLTEENFKRLVLLPDSARLIENDDSARPGGTACLIKADLNQAGSGAVSLKLTEFPDPQGEGIYFQLADPRRVSRDELLTGDTGQTDGAGSEPTHFVTSTP